MARSKAAGVLKTGEKEDELPPIEGVKGWSDGIPVYCAFDEIVATASLKPNPMNPNTHPDDQVELLGEVISGAGWRAPIVVSLRSGFIVKGHCRLLAAKKQGMLTAPVDY